MSNTAANEPDDGQKTTSSSTASPTRSKPARAVPVAVVAPVAGNSSAPTTPGMDSTPVEVTTDPITVTVPPVTTGGGDTPPAGGDQSGDGSGDGTVVVPPVEVTLPLVTMSTPGLSLGL
jgi:hypothetical protein